MRAYSVFVNDKKVCEVKANSAQEAGKAAEKNADYVHAIVSNIESGIACESHVKLISGKALI